MGSCRSNCTETCLQRKARHWWEQAWGVCVQCRGIVRASLLSKGFLTQLSTCKLQQKIPQLFLGYLLMLLLSFPTWHTAFLSLCCPARVQQCFGWDPAGLIVLLSFSACSYALSVAPSCVPGVCLEHSSRSCCFGVLLMKYKNVNCVIIEISGAQKL